MPTVKFMKKIEQCHWCRANLTMEEKPNLIDHGGSYFHKKCYKQSSKAVDKSIILIDKILSKPPQKLKTLRELSEEELTKPEDTLEKIYLKMRG